LDNVQIAENILYVRHREHLNNAV